MLRVLIGCTDGGRAEADLAPTLLWRDNVQRDVVTTLSAAEAAMRERPSLVLLERDTPWAAAFVASVRESDAKRATSIAVYGHEPGSHAEMELLAAGANAVLRLPVSADWDKRLARLLQVPPRQSVRVPVFVEVDGGGTVRTTLGTSINLSEHGLLVQTPALDLGAEIQFAMRLPGVAEPVRGRGRVVRVGSDDAFGLEFSEISGECLQAIRDFVQRAGF